MYRAILLFLILLLSRFAQAGDAKPSIDDEIAAFVRGAEIQNVRWTKYDGSDFKQFYCVADAPRAGVAGLHLTAGPVMAEANGRDIVVEGSLGRYPVKWIRRVIKDGSRQAETVVHYAPRGWAHVLIEAPDEVGLLRFISEFGRLAIFAPPVGETRFVGPGFIDSGLRAERAFEPGAGTN
ncbi:MAG TPA: hypothetical protein VF683_11095 [Chthoniobacterales bacterium]